MNRKKTDTLRVKLNIFTYFVRIMKYILDNCNYLCIINLEI